MQRVFEDLRLVPPARFEHAAYGVGSPAKPSLRVGCQRASPEPCLQLSKHTALHLLNRHLLARSCRIECEVTQLESIVFASVNLPVAFRTNRYLLTVD
jgi:hypothetical protein